MNSHHFPFVPLILSDISHKEGIVSPFRLFHQITQFWNQRLKFQVLVNAVLNRNIGGEKMDQHFIFFSVQSRQRSLELHITLETIPILIEQ